MANVKPENITAEWTVHAQLTIKRPNDKPTNSNDNVDSSNAADDVPTQANPVTIVYKWSSDDVKNESSNDKSGFSSTNATFKSDHKSDTNDKAKHDSFHSTGVPPSDSGFSTTTNNSRKQSPFRSTCSIVLSACTDLFPTTVEEGQEDPITYNTTATCTVVPEEPPRLSNASDFIKNVNFLSVKDAFSQTSDNESKLKSDKSAKPSHDSRKRRPYDYRRTTESMLSHLFEEAKQYSPSRHVSRSPHRSPSNTLSPSSSTRGNNHKKSPRTVHIDVYCTGSDAEDSSAEDDSEASSYNHRFIEEESNSTPQTVYNSEQVKLQHRIADKNELPRRFASQLYEKAPSPSPIQSRNHLLTKSTSKDEISESKQLLFNRHIGAQASKQQSKFTMGSNRNRFTYRRDQSDDCLSSIYPNSSRSTMRDMTCSSISSGVLASSNSVNDYLDSSSWKDTDCETGKADSDQWKSDELNEFLLQSRKWRSPEKERRFLLQQKKMIEYMHQNERFIEERRENARSESVRRSTDKENNRAKAVSPLPTAQRVCCGQVVNEPHQQPTSHAQSSVHKLVLSPVQAIDAQQTNEKHKRVLFTPSYSPSSQTSSVQSTILDSANEHWARARKFGAVVGAMRKTGHHFGPAKNPDCQCEHCRRWVAERDQFRSRTLSVGDEPYNRSLFWLKRH
ncbi:serine/arginine repetitive matrix protein 5 [Bradysia coprophila]|uniref:serine/arginine repetitive matrix protein 5 n=1 Tax=Bradysia coprophila TaxID=38358 RepID=UPI00187D9BF4|nr:serine/arginine repetitive matrix protein 5 [Bradysia coprophila]XP_037044896.1 serine/arginine repetitive matrix protein 5 [Bradysia coprophila]XP_037044898.1 serine/arginine repetitive matrix protein 5 [Bradysia coprophila]